MRSVTLKEAGSNLNIFHSEITFENPKKESSYYYTIAKDFEWSFVAIHATTGLDGDKDFYHLKVEQVSRLPADFKLAKNVTSQLDKLLIFKIDLPLDKKSDLDQLTVYEYHKGRREPYPKTIKVYEKQTVELYESKYYLSLYPTQESNFVLRIKSEDVKHYSQAPDKIENDVVIYGPFLDLPPVSFFEIHVFFVFPYPLPYFKEASRSIYVSHWGSIAIDEYFHIFNEAAGINGQFSRVDYMPHYNPNQGQNAIANLATELPQYIRGLYYYDYIGNISSSRAFRHSDKVSFEIEPRFPIFGNWKTDWNQGYNMPTEFHLFQDLKDSKEHTLEVDFMHAYDSSLNEEYKVNVILPEGASDIRLELPSSCGINSEDITMTKYYGTLDYFGRPMVTIYKQNAVHDLCDNVLTVRYQYDNQVNLYMKAICLTTLLFTLYAAAMAYVRMGLSLETKDTKPKQKTI